MIFLSCFVQGPVTGGNTVSILVSGGSDMDFVSPAWINSVFGQTPGKVKSLRPGLSLPTIIPLSEHDCFTTDNGFDSQESWCWRRWLAD
jgi:hypothetical protein